MQLRANLSVLLLSISLITSIPLYAATELTASTTQTTKIAPVEAYAALPGARNARLSPDGNHLALIAPVKGRDTLVVWDLNGKEQPSVIPLGEFEPEWIIWKSNRRLIAAMRFYSMRDPNNPTVDTRLIAFDTDGGHPIELVRTDLFKTYIPQIQDKVVSFLPDDESHILIELPALERGLSMQDPTVSTGQYGSMDSRIKFPEVVKVDVNTGRLTTLVHQRGKVVQWKADAAGNVRLGRSLNGNMQDYQVRNLNDGTWQTIQSYELNKGRVFRPLAFVEDHPERLYVISNHEGGANSLYELDTNQDQFIRTVADGNNGAIDTIVSNNRLIGYQIGNKAPVYLDSSYTNDTKLINRALPGTSHEIIDRSKDGKRTLVEVTKGNEPSAFWVLDRQGEKPVLSTVVETYPELEPEQISESRWVSYTARDSTNIPALLTLPINHSKSDQQLLPFIVLPHGGPTSHDIIGFDYEVQFLISRGYGVLQPQFRGSNGFGAAFETAGLQQWGLLMQDDVTDGTRWLIDQKLADPARIAIVGSSYGGYSALMGAVKEPELYRCAVAIAPVTDLQLLIEHLSSFYFGDINIPRIGSDSSILQKTSPARNTEKIRIPLLVIHGRKDYTVPVAHTEELAGALRKNNKPAEIVYLNDADHYLSRYNDRLAALKAVDKFLSTNLPTNK